ncbi:hypothetical protein [Curtobacterium sp. MCBD17_040]|uniref:hypothetical protein n=1 Tax=Curtobacterium sp. MCBD17_040 TaxID=2175674 RepID=UPI0015E881E8|nr:hypothetical protein [Curtobacterium sp. MCBD17_040]WIB65698.1 hypothetical protein DEI94_16385 [Curtobacterium sp. MCBD17_040]
MSMTAAAAPRMITRERDVAGLPNTTRFAARRFTEPAVTLTASTTGAALMIPEIPVWSPPPGTHVDTSPWAPAFGAPTLTDGPDDPIGFDFDHSMDRFEPVTVAPRVDLNIADDVVDSISVRDLGSYLDGNQFEVTATKQVNLLEALNPAGQEDLRRWLEDNRAVAADFFAVQYRADIPDTGSFRALDVSVHAVIPATSDRTITRMQTYSYTVQHTEAKQLQVDITSGRIRELFREHTQNTASRTNMDVGYTLPDTASPHEHYEYQNQSKADAVREAVARDGNRLISDRAAYWLCQTLPRQQYPELYRYAHNRVADKRVLATELEHTINTAAAAGFKPGQRESLHALWNYFTYGADNR